MRLLFFFLSVLIATVAVSQTRYHVSFPNAVHHEANVVVEFDNLADEILEVRMSRSSPGRYAIHDFAKNVFSVKAVDQDGKALKVIRASPQQWNVAGHSGYVKFSYTLFANRADGTYSQVDESHAHLNMPATLVYSPTYAYRPVEVTYDLSAQKNWKVATQLKPIGGNQFFAPNMQYLMDSPAEIGDLVIKEFQVESKGKTYTIRFALDHDGDSEELISKYFDWIKRIVREQKEVFGELPDFDFGTYTFLACYRSNASGDGMEHRNSTVLTSSASLSTGGGMYQIGTVSHEFFHAWNVERLRPHSLEPFSFEDANMSGELWFAEGFTSYYTKLILCRAGIISRKEYVEGLAGALNYVWNSLATDFFNPIEMSYQAPFVDAATSVDPTNRENTFISYYSYGSVLGLALDLSLRGLERGLNLDDYMAMLWEMYGSKEIPYTIKDLQQILVKYAGQQFADNFFNKYIYNAEKPDYQTLMAKVGVSYAPMGPDELIWGGKFSINNSDNLHIAGNPAKGTPVYEAGLTKNDRIVRVDGQAVQKAEDMQEIARNTRLGQSLEVVYVRFGKERTTQVILQPSKNISTSLFEDSGKKLDKKASQARDSWLQTKQ
ncbi:MAG: PDZ domain-containing protein [Bacteroidota bacterium]